MRTDDTLGVVYQHYLTQEPYSQQDEHTYLLSPKAGSGSIKRVTTYSGIEILSGRQTYFVYARSCSSCHAGNHDAGNEGKSIQYYSGPYSFVIVR